MEIKISMPEAEALMRLNKMLRTAATPTPKFLEWIAARLVLKCGDSDLTDYVQKLREYATELEYIQELLSIKR